MKNKLQVVKIGGNIINDEQLLDKFLSDFAQLEGAKILVHGGGKLATELSKQLGVVTQMINGRRVTSDKDIDIVTMVYAGLINKKITAKLQGNHCNAIGLSGADANSIQASKRPASPTDYGWVGDIESVNNETIALFLENNITPVFCAISHDNKGQLLNTNADTISSEIAISMSENFEVTLIYCFEKQGVLKDVNDENSVISSINTEVYSALKKNKIIHEGMLPKMENCFHALANNVSKVKIGNINMINNTNSLYTTLTL